jgi:hypothetical protein
VACPRGPGFACEAARPGSGLVIRS